MEEKNRTIKSEQIDEERIINKYDFKNLIHLDLDDEKLSKILSHKEPQNKIPSIKCIFYSLIISFSNISKKYNNKDLENYTEHLQKNPWGTLSKTTFNGWEVNIFGANFSYLNPESMWQMMHKISPKKIILACRPDKNIPDFKINLRNPETKLFSTRKYIDQCTLENSILYSNFNLIKNTIETIEKKFWLDFSKKGINFDELSEEIFVGKERQLKRNRLTERVPEELMSTISLFAFNKNLPLILGDLPDIIHRERVCNLFTVGQIKEVLSQSSFALGRSPELSPRIPVNVCFNNIHPVYGQGNEWGNPFFNLFAPINDFYMSVLTANLCLREQNKRVNSRNKTNKNKILIISSPGSNAGISSFLKMIENGEIPRDLLVDMDETKQKFNILDLLKVPPPLENIFLKSYLEEIVEKNAIWDVLVNPLKPNFKNASSIIHKYLNREDYKDLTPEEIENEKSEVRKKNLLKDTFDSNKETRELSYSEKFEELEYLYRCLFLEYQKVFFKMVRKGSEGLESAFYREAIQRK